MATRWEDLAPGVVRRRLSGWDETVGAVAGTDGVLLVDAGPSLPAGEEIGAELRDRFGVPVTHVVLTHPHFDHVLGAGAFPAAERFGRLPAGGPAEAAADAVRQGLDAGLAEAAAGALAALPPPREIALGERLTLDLGGGRTVVLAALGPAHSPNDLVVLVPGPVPVVFCGDLVEESGEPQAGTDAEPARWPAALDRLLALGGPEARYVPGHGAVVDAAFVRAQRAALAERFGDVPGAA
ncbi:MBL fold metallo-hydrolase [Streptomyces millisiae]|uniref:MBL fold metallo-hydrolase n=1 Tax=Streptomyces millisiae TaxID=3075542 RepID=A0ABU2M250_9ACTN|nr:MBL fold metallo-hydrolase [Streptomyces sp. DSM 44918]MDT0323457.1 MBL fold metallo-hydrolase [Streptomyces sp. DSM 44918]